MFAQSIGYQSPGFESIINKANLDISLKESIIENKIKGFVLSLFGKAFAIKSDQGTIYLPTHTGKKWLISQGRDFSGSFSAVAFQKVLEDLIRLKQSGDTTVQSQEEETSLPFQPSDQQSTVPSEQSVEVPLSEQSFQEDMSFLYQPLRDDNLILEETSSIKTSYPMINGFSQEEIKAALQEVAPEESIPENLIEEAFESELTRENTLGKELEEMIQDLGFELDDYSPQEIQNLTSLLLISNNSSDFKMDRLFTKYLMSTVLNKFQANKGYINKEIRKIEKQFIEKFQVSNIKQIGDNEVAPVKELLFMQSLLKNKNTVFSKTIETTINGIVMKQFNRIHLELTELMEDQERNNEKIKERVFAAMAILQYLSEHIPFEEDNEHVWLDISDKYNQILEIKNKGGIELRQLISEVFQEFQTFIDDGIFTYLIKNHKEDLRVEEWTQVVYGLSADTMEEIKKSNREKVAGLIKELAEQLRSGEKLTKEMITQLHRVNNEGIVPKQISKLRKDEWEKVTFGKREGLSPTIVEAAVDILVEKMNEQLQKRIKNNFFSKLSWSVNVARFHNDFLDIHPFLDRNGSTSLLLVELLMTAGGSYQPPVTRMNKYYKNLLNILKSPIAVAVIAYEHYKISHKPGSFDFKSLA